MSRNRSKISIGIVGCGTIGAELAEWVRTRLKNKARIAALYDLNPSQSKRLKESLSVNAVSVGSLEQLIAESDFVIEAAGVEAVPVVAKKALQKGKDLLIMSVGGLLNHPELMAIAQEHGSKIYVPSGAIGGLDAVKAAALSKITTAVLTTRKSPQSLAGAPYWNEKRENWEDIREETILFEGKVQEAVRLFPKNINVSATLQLALSQFPCAVKIVAVPGLNKNIHEIEIIAEAGRMVFRLENEPSPKNPRTSYLAVLSAKALLEEIFSNVRVGN